MPNATREQQELAESIATLGWVVTPPVLPQLAIDHLMGTIESLGANGGGGAQSPRHDTGRS